MIALLLALGLQAQPVPLVQVNGEYWGAVAAPPARPLAAIEIVSLQAGHLARTRRALEYLNKAGPIALQSHTGAVWFRNIKLRKLPAAP